MSKRDFYDILGVSRGCSQEELKQAWRNLVKEHHPDRNQGSSEAEKRFREVNEAYEALKDPRSREAYDRYGHAASEQQHNGAAGGGFGDFADIFEGLFGNRQRSNDGVQGGHLRYGLKLSLEEAFHGKTTEVTFSRRECCKTCGGSGARPGSKPTVCAHCGGVGRIRVQLVFGNVIEQTCPICHGSGRVITEPCPDCGGVGLRDRSKTLEVHIPAGVEDGANIRLSGEGDAGTHGSSPGCLYIALSIKKHPIFERDGPTIRCQAPIMMTTAVLGGSIHVPTIDGGRISVAIPAGTQSGACFRLCGKGMSVLRKSVRGDMLVSVQVETPVNLTTEQKKLLRTFEEACGPEPHSPESHGFFKRIKDAWDHLTE